MSKKGKFITFALILIGVILVELSMYVVPFMEEIKALESKKIDMTFQLNGSEVSKILEYTNEKMDRYFYRFELKVYWENKYRSKYSGIIKFRCRIARCGREDKWVISSIDRGICELV